jgi:UDP-GlcNAc:undecaprenyl-phosphate GlcNAc-1-phosphate transferase
MVIFILTFFVAVAFSLLLTPLIASAGARAGIVDRPGTRKIHEKLTPRVGGAAIALTLALTLLVVYTWAPALRSVSLPDPATLMPILLSSGIVFLVGLCDDIRGLPAWLKLVGELLAAGIIVTLGIVIDRVTVLGTVYELGWLSIPATLFWIVIITNAFNLVDGVDGLASGLVAIAASTCATVLIARGDQAEALLLVAFVGAVIGFLPYNFNPAEVFLGDSGSLLCGFLLAVTAIAGRQKGATALAVGVPLIIFALPIADTFFSVVRRMGGTVGAGGGLRPWQRVRLLSNILVADQGHIHHRLIATGLSHRRTVLMLYAFAILCSVLALVTMQLP